MARGSIDFGLIRRFVKHEFSPHVARALFAVGFMVIAAIATTASAWIIQYVIDDLFVSKRADLIWMIAGAIMVIYVSKGAATYGYNFVLARISASLSATMRRRVLGKMLDQDIAFFDQNETADLVNRISNVTKSSGDLVRVLMMSAMRDGLTVVCLIVFMLYKDWLLTLLTFAIAPPIIGGVTLISKRIRNSVSGEFENTSHFMTLLYERLAGMRLIRSFRNESETLGQFETTIDNLEERAVKIARVSALNSPLMEALGGIAVAIIIIYAGFAIIDGRSTAGEVVAFILAFVSAYEPIKRLASLRVDLVKFSIPLGYYYDLIDQSPAQCFGEESLPTTLLPVSFENVHFSYADGPPALNGVSFEAPAGKTTALVGRSGSGKSTLFALVQRFYDQTGGSIKLGGVDIRELSKDALARTIATIPQETTLFTASIAENIAIGKPDATMAQIESAAHAAHMGEFLKNMPEGLSTMLGEGHVSLSGGQKQRLSVARAILKDAPILLLDEATSALDSESEAIVQKAINHAASGKTVLVIAHRLSTIKDADQIVVMEQGQAVENGTHAELKKQKSGIYAMLHDLQFQA